MHKIYALAVTHWKHVTSERGFDDADSGREGKPDTEKPKGQLPSYHLTTTANPLRTQPHSQSESVHNSGDITLYFDLIYDHQHHELEDDVPADQCEAAIRDVATEAVEFIRQVVSDQVVFRCGLFVTGSQTKRPPTAFSRTWRRLTPWVKEAVWSGRVSSRGIP